MDLQAQRFQDEQRVLAEVDQVLTVRQRARFLLFLEQMEREKVNLIVRAQGGRIGQGAVASPQSLERATIYP